MKTILITGSNGFIASNFVNTFKDKYNFVLLSHKKIPSNITIEELYSNNNLLNSIDLVLNLAGANIGDKRWTSKRKKELLESRIITTEKLVNIFNKLDKKPHLISASAVGIYTENVDNDESSIIDYQNHENFSQEITKKWELAAQQYRGPLTITRFGVVLSKNGGAFPKMLKPFLLYTGSILSNGLQYMPWIAMLDLLNALDYIISNQYTGIYNLIAPEIINNFQLSNAIAKTWNKPIIGKMPNFIIKMLFGQMGKELFLNSIKVSSNRLKQENFIFKYPNISDALIAIKNQDLN